MDATTPGAACPQLSDAIPLAFVETKDMREDCLSLRIARPAGTNPGAKLPVVVWLHGGGVVKGSAYDPHFQPDRMINYSKTLGKPVIYVALNYRLSIFRFCTSTYSQRTKINECRYERSASWVPVDQRTILKLSVAILPG